MMDDLFPEITAKIAEYERTHDDRHTVNSYRPWECDHNCRQCLLDEGADLAYKAVVKDLRDLADAVEVTAENAWGRAVATKLRIKADWYEQRKHLENK